MNNQKIWDAANSAFKKADEAFAKADEAFARLDESKVTETITGIKLDSIKFQAPDLKRRKQLVLMFLRAATKMLITGKVVIQVKRYNLLPANHDKNSHGLAEFL